MQLELANDKVQASVAAAEPKSVPALIEYVVAGEGWRCGAFDRLAGEIPCLAAGAADAREIGERLARWQEAIQGQARAWLIVRRLFGIQPVLPPRDFVEDDFRQWQREELRSALGMTRAQLAAELDAIRGVAESLKSQVQNSKPPPAEPSPAAVRGELDLEDGQELLERYGLAVKLASLGERTWFAQRVEQFSKLLDEPPTSGLARNTLMTEVQLRQLDVLLADPASSKMGGPEWRANMKARQELDATYQKQLSLIETLAPWAKGITGKYNFTGVLSDVTAAIQAYHGRQETRLIDGLFTAMGIRVECRRSVQLPQPRYRAGLVVFVAAAKQGLWDPNWQSPFTAGELKRLDEGWRGAFTAVSDAAGVSVPDLEKDGSEGEYEKLVPTPALA